ncbi:MAG: PTS sugar transporter subunit IIA [Candidatus Delongbacteria bacterium]
MKLSHLLDTRHVLAVGQARDARDGIEQLVGLLAASGAVRDPARALELVLEREREYPTGIGSGVAIPHCNCLDQSEPVVALGLFDPGLDFQAPDGPAFLVFLLLSPSGNSGGHLKLLARISRLARHDLCARLRPRRTAADLLQGLQEAEQDFVDL